MTSAPRFTCSRTPSRNSSGPSQMRTAPLPGIPQYQGTTSLLWAVVLSSRPQGTTRGPGTRPRSIARFTPGSTSWPAPAPTTDV